MAANFSADNSNALSLLFQPEIARQFNQVAKTAQLLPASPGFGKSLNWDVEIAGATAASYAEGTAVADGELAFNPIIPATLAWGLYRTSFQISDSALNEAASSPFSATALMDLLGERVMNGVSVLTSLINKDLLTGTGTDGSGNPTYVGLLGGALATTGTYATISRSTYPSFASNVVNALSSNLSVDLLDQLEQKIFTASSQVPNLIVCDPATYRKYKGLFSPIQRVDGTGPFPRMDLGPMASSGEPVVFYNNIPIYRDKDVTAGTLIMLNTKHVTHKYLEWAPMFNSDDESAFVEAKGSNGDEESTPAGIKFKIKRLAETGDFVKFMISTQVAMGVKRPNAFGTITNINVT